MRGYRQLLLLTIPVTLALLWRGQPSISAAGPPLPFVSGLASQTAPAGGASATVRLFGTFTDGDSVTISGVPLPTTFVSSHELRVVLDASFIAQPSTLELRVRNASGQSQALQLFVSRRRIGFALGSTTIPVQAEPISLALARLNGDAFPDVAIATSAGLSVALSDGAGGFNVPESVPLSRPPTEVVTADFDGDRDDDLLALQGAAGAFTPLRNDGNAGLTALAPVATGHVDDPALAVGDLDGDGHLDVLVANETEGTIGVHLGVGDGTFLSSPPFGSVQQPMSPVIADFNGDSALDVAVVSSASGVPAIHAGNGDGTFGPAVPLPQVAPIVVSPGSSPSLQGGDLDGNGRADLILLRLQLFGAWQERILLGLGDGTFADPPPGPPQLLVAASLDLADVNGDGNQDCVTTDASFQIQVRRGDGTGRVPLWTSQQMPFQPRRVKAWDVNLDGMVDLIVMGVDTSVFPTQPRLFVMYQLDPGPPPQLVLPDATFTETDAFSTIVTMPVRVVDASGQPVATTVPVTITLEFEDGTAEQGADYRPSPAPSFSIPAGVTEGQIDFRIVGGTTFEKTESFTVRIATADAAVIQDGTATVTILDNDPPPPEADLSTTLTMDDDLGPGDPVTGTLTLRNSGPAVVQNPSASIQVDALDLGKLSNIQIISSTFAVPSVNGGLLRAFSVGDFRPGLELSFTFSATPTAAATTPRDLAFSEGSSSLFPLNYAFNQASSPGRTGVAFAEDGDNRVNDLMLHDPEPNQLHIVHDADSPTTSTEVVSLGTAFPNYTVSSLNVCRLGGDEPSAVLALARNPGASGDEGLVVRRGLSPSSAGASFDVVMRSQDYPLLGTVCDDFFVNGVNDVAAFGPNEVIVARNNRGVFIRRPPLTPLPGATLHGMVGGDFNGDGVNDIAVLGEFPQFVIDGRVGGGTVLLPLMGDASGGFTPGALVDLSHLGHVPALVGGNGFDPVSNLERPIDLNADGFSDLVAACTSCGSGGTYGVVPIRNLGAVAPGQFRVQPAIAVGEQPKRHGRITMLGTPRVNDTVIMLTAKDGFNRRLKNTTPAGADEITFGYQPELLGGSGPSGVMALNAFDDQEVDFLALGVNGFLRLDTGKFAIGAVDPEPSNDGERRTVVFRPPTPSFDLTFGAAWRPGALGQLQGTGLSGARVWVEDQNGTRADQHVVSSNGASLAFLWGANFYREFSQSGATLTLRAETAGGTGTSRTEPTIEPDNGQPVVSVDPEVGWAESVDPRFPVQEVPFDVGLSKPSDNPVRVRVTTADGDARAGLDYTRFSQDVEFSPGETYKGIVLRILDDGLDEFDESFSVSLSDAVGATIGAARTEVTIVDDDGPPEVLLSSLRVTEGNAGTTTATVTATLVGPLGAPNEGEPTTSGKPVTLDVTAIGVTATPVSDFRYLPNMYILAPGEGSAAIDIEINGDTTVEGDETLQVNVTATNAVSAGPSLVTIANDDLPPQLSVLDVVVDENLDTPSGPLVVTKVVLSDPSDVPVRVKYITADGSALGTADYVETTGEIVIPARATMAEIRTFLKDDTLVEGDETYFINVLEATGAIVRDGQGMVTIVDDDVARDNEPPQIVAPPDVTALATNGGGAVVTYPAPIVTDNNPGASVACVPPSGAVFPIGTTTVVCTATDAVGNTAQSTFTVTVDAGAPRVVTRVVGQGVSPQGGRFVDVAIRNSGTGHARNVTVSSMLGRARAANGTVTPVPFSNFTPLFIGSLAINTERVTRLHFVPPAEGTISVTTQGTLTDVRDAPLRQYSSSSSFRLSAAP